MELKEMIIEEDTDNGVYAISLVTTPATGEEFVMLSEQKPIDLKFAEVSKDERLLLGLVLQPNQKIYRRDANGEEYEIFFREETIKKAAQLYLQNQHQHNVTFEHQTEIEGVTMVESWIVADSQKDKSAAYGKEYPVGSWIAVLKVNDPKMWEDFKANSTIKGFSLEGLFTPKKQVTEMSAVEKLNYLRSII